MAARVEVSALHRTLTDQDREAATAAAQELASYLAGRAHRFLSKRGMGPEASVAILGHIFAIASMVSKAPADQAQITANSAVTVLTDFLAAAVDMATGADKPSGGLH